MDLISKITLGGIEIISVIFVFLAGLLAVTILVFFLIDRLQTRDAIRHNYPVVGRFRYLFTWLGEFFRQYFFALDREELPFNRAEREWIHHAARKRSPDQPFGSTRSMTQVGTPIFAPASFPMLDDQCEDLPPVIFGPQTKHPYAAQSVIHVSGMSFGALSAPAIEALSIGAAAAGCWLNTGEGGLSPWHLKGGCDIIFQIGTAKYGCRDKEGNFSPEKFTETAGCPEVKMIELKLAQGAKPGKGGILPAAKVTEEIAEIRGIHAGQASISPNRHPEIGNFAELLDFIAELRRLSGKPVGLKTVLGGSDWLDGLLREVAERGAASAPDFITLDGGDGGTGAAPLALIDNAGLTLREALPLLTDGLARHGLRERIKVICAGKLVTPVEVAWAYATGADAVNTARGFMFSIGCIQAMRCHTNNCPTGVTTHKKRLQAGLDPKDKAVRVEHYVTQMGKDVGTIAHSCGVPHARALRRTHVRMVQGDGRSVPMSVLYPEQHVPG